MPVRRPCPRHVARWFYDEAAQTEARGGDGELLAPAREETVAMYTRAARARGRMSAER